MRILQTARFKKAAKKLHSNQKRDLDETVKTIIEDLAVGELKVGDLAGIRVYRFKMSGQLTLLAYSFLEQELTLTLLTFGSHENFYRELNR